VVTLHDVVDALSLGHRHRQFLRVGTPCLNTDKSIFSLLNHKKYIIQSKDRKIQLVERYLHEMLG
jgi:hypothetical protein